MPTRTMVIGFVDLTLFSRSAAGVSDDDLATMLDGWYEIVGAIVTGANGRVVKWMGDGGLFVWDEADLERAVTALLAIKDRGDAWLEAREWPCRVIGKMHVGPVFAGELGGVGDKRFDVAGKHVNATAMMKSTGVALSSDVFARLPPELCRRFGKVTPPSTYVRVEDERSFRDR